MFTISQSNGYWWDCKINLVDEEGTQVEGVLPLQFKRLSQEEYEACNERIKIGHYTSDQQLCKELVIGWRDVALTEVPVEFTTDHFDSLLNMQGVPAQIVQNWFEAVQKARIKN